MQNSARIAEISAKVAEGYFYTYIVRISHARASQITYAYRQLFLHSVIARALIINNAYRHKINDIISAGIQ